MFKNYIVLVLLLNLAVSDGSVNTTFGEIRYVYRALQNPCRSDFYTYSNPIFAGVRTNASTAYRCWMWSRSGTAKSLVERMMGKLPITSDFCEDFEYDSIRSESDLKVPVEFDEGTFMVLYEVMKFELLMK